MKGKLQDKCYFLSEYQGGIKNLGNFGQVEIS